MAITYDGDFTVALASSDRRLSQPFSDQGDNVSQMFEQDYTVNTVDFAPSSLGTSHPDFPDFYLVSEGPLQSLGGGVSKFVRTYAQIPRSRTIGESYAMTFAGMTNDSVRQLYAVTASLDSGGTTTLTLTPSISDITTGDLVIIRYSFSDAKGYTYYRTAFRTATSASGSSLAFATVSEPSAVSSITYLTAIKKPSNRAEFTEVVSSFQQLDYFLPGVSSGISAPSDIPIFTRQTIVDVDGAEVKTYTVDTSPSVTEYEAQIAGKQLIVAEASIITVWKGPIYQRSTRFVVAR